MAQLTSGTTIGGNTAWHVGNLPNPIQTTGGTFTGGITFGAGATLSSGQTFNNSGTISGGTLSNNTISNPTLSGTVSGSAIFSSSQTFNSTIITTGTQTPLQVQNLNATPGTVPAAGTIAVVNNQWYISNGTSWNAMSAQISLASTTTTGIVKIGSGINVDANGVISTNISTLGAAPSGYGLGTFGQQIANGTDLNTVRNSGFYRINAGVNAPPRVNGDNASIWHYVIADSHDNASWASQLAIEYNTATVFARTQNNGVWQAWKKLLNDTDSITTQSTLTTNGLSTPSAPTVTVVGTAGTTTYTYYVVAKDINGNRTPVSAVTSITTGNATLSTTNYNTISWASVPGAVSYDVLKTNTSTALATGVTSTSLNDTGQATAAYTPPAYNETSGVIVNNGKLQSTGRFILPVGTNLY